MLILYNKKKVLLLKRVDNMCFSVFLKMQSAAYASKCDCMWKRVRVEFLKMLVSIRMNCHTVYATVSALMKFYGRNIFSFKQISTYGLLINSIQLVK